MAYRWIRHGGPVVLWMAVIFAMSTGIGSPAHTLRWLLEALHLIAPSRQFHPDELGLADHILRKLAHFTEYAILSWLSYRAARYGAGSPVRRAIGWGWLVAALYSITDEYHQRFVPTRTGQASDFLIDMSGALAASLILLLTTRAGVTDPVRRT